MVQLQLRYFCVQRQRATQQSLIITDADRSLLGGEHWN